MKYKRNLYAIIVTTIIYFALNLCYEKIIIKDQFSVVYALSRNVSRGEKILESDLVKIKILVNDLTRYYNLNNEGGYYRDDYVEGSVLLKNMTLAENDYIKTKVEKEIISVKLGFAEDAASYQIEKGSIINLFYSAKTAEIENIMNGLNKSNITSNNLENGFVTIKLLENAEILNCYDKYGNKAKKGNIIETILIEVPKEESIKIYNLKNYGKFTISIIK